MSCQTHMIRFCVRISRRDQESEEKVRAKEVPWMRYSKGCAAILSKVCTIIMRRRMSEGLVGETLARELIAVDVCIFGAGRESSG